jgi:hypothetical protein
MQPRPSEEVVWYSDCIPREGRLLGHDARGAPVVLNHLGHTQTLDTFDQLRLKNPHHRPPPAWHTPAAPIRIVRPHPHESIGLRELLNRRIPPGPRYLELLQEIAIRGFDAFLVGGTVRDILRGKTPNDVDVVTSMPLQRAIPLLASMYRRPPQINAENGYVRIGGTPKSKDPFIDLKSMVKCNPGTADVVFSSSIVDDAQYRDFSCNAVYYDPINDVLIDPNGSGISAASDNRLDLISSTDRPPYDLAKICIRYFKFVLRGFSASIETSATIQTVYMPCLDAMKRSQMTGYIRSQLLSKEATCDHEKILDDLRQAMVSFGAIDCWENSVAPLISDLLDS